MHNRLASVSPSCMYKGGFGGIMVKILFLNFGWFDAHASLSKEMQELHSDFCVTLKWAAAVRNNVQ